MIETVWVLGMPNAYRDFFAQSLASVDVRYTSIRYKLSEQLYRIKTDGTHLVAYWPTVRAMDHDDFFRDFDVGLATVEIIPSNLHGFADRLSGYARPNFGFRLRKEPVRWNDWTLGGVNEEAIDVASILSRYVAAGDASARVAPAFLMDLVAGQGRLLILSGQGAIEEQADYVRHALAQFRAHHPDGDVGLVISDVARPEDEDAMLAEYQATVAPAPFELGWLACRPPIVTDDLRLARECHYRGLDVELLRDGTLETRPFGTVSAEHLLEAEYLTNCVYRKPAEDEPMTFSDAIDRVALQDLNELFSLPSRTGKRLPDGSPAKVANWLSPLSRVTVFDNRSRGGLLTCILPFRFSPDRSDAFERLSYAEADARKPDTVEILVVDDGSEPAAAERTRKLCAEMGYSYAYVDTAEEVFSVGRCRNVGAQYAGTDFILMQDIDLMPYNGFYNDLLREIEIQGMLKDAKHFLMVPYIFLTRNGTELYRRMDEEARRQFFIHSAITADGAMVEKFSTGTSANVYNRHWYLSRGGNDDAFEGWGYEDLEFNTRAIRHLQYFPLPREWAKEKFNFNSVSEFSTYKAIYRFFGDMLMMKGIALFHAWHPTGNKSEYAEKESINRDLFIKKIQMFPKYNVEPPPLPNKSQGVSLMFRSNAFTYQRCVAPALGDVLYIPDEEIIYSREILNSVVDKFDVKRVIFFNPYQTPNMEEIYGWVREMGLEFFVAERGALPHSSFFDPNGFLFDSATYDPARWDKPLTIQQIKAVEDYVSKIRATRPALEDQPEGIGGRALRAELGIPENHRVIFVALQRPGDTVTRFFGRNVSYPDYVEQVRALCSNLPPDVHVLIKTHPLEDAGGSWGNALMMDNANIYDLLEAADLVWTYNSGVGILAMLWRRSVALSGGSFYAAEGVNHYVETPEDVLGLLRKEQLPDWEKIVRFINLLVNDLYSFGKHVTKRVKMPDNSNMTATTDIRYEQLRIGDKLYRFSDRAKPVCGWNSILFDRYRFSEQALNKSS
ncbi:glycosyltransferase [Sphingobium sp. BHU LFT2]|uniref:capsular polysaccharide export protein, LipB/KpsS family n=1 Tax=Sphingobium sp. BHU LFT2 TaxID=2807634 RepID=UPI001BEC0340|nr:glycosyltransferase [Sphingobium sp. BHU LFT2]MBT2243643.1 glycosyltransferase [Sphingobium sp. BHU LFT2]